MDNNTRAKIFYLLFFFLVEQQVAKRETIARREKLFELKFNSEITKRKLSFFFVMRAAHRRDIVKVAITAQAVCLYMVELKLLIGRYLVTCCEAMTPKSFEYYFLLFVVQLPLQR